MLLFLRIILSLIYQPLWTSGTCEFTKILTKIRKIYPVQQKKHGCLCWTICLCVELQLIQQKNEFLTKERDLSEFSKTNQEDFQALATNSVTTV